MNGQLFILCLLSYLLVAVLLPPAFGYDWSSYDVDDFEESAGSMASVLFNPSDGIYGVSVSDGTWLTGTPVFGDFFLPIFYNEREEALYAGMGLTLRIMPHWTYAPFVGGGGSYNLSLSGISEDGGSDEPIRGKSYWGGHVESGLRIYVDSVFYEIMGRYTWSSSEIENPDYLAVRIGCGTDF